MNIQGLKEVVNDMDIFVMLVDLQNAFWQVIYFIDMKKGMIYLIV